MVLEFVYPPIYVLAVLTVIYLCLHFTYLWLRVDFNTRRVWEMDVANRQTLTRYYFCAIMQALYKSGGVFHPTIPGEEMEPVKDDGGEGTREGPTVLAIFFPPKSERMLITNCVVFRDKLQEYKDCISYSGEPGQIPPVFPSAYFNKPIIALGSSQFSRVRVLGIVHLRQEITVYQDLRPLLTGSFSLTLLAEEYRRTDRGLEVDIRTGVWNEKGTLVWDAKVSGVSLLKANPRRKRIPKVFTRSNAYREELITAPLDTGLQFARATLDWQPQHLTKWTAKMVGFDAPIAHGLWTMAMATDRIMSNEKCYKDVYPLHIGVTFKRPLVLPGEGLLQYDKPDGPDNRIKFKVIKPDNFTPILDGYMFTGDNKNAQ